jgi:hypothetical protein
LLAASGGTALPETSDGWLVFPGLPQDRVPELVAALVREGARIMVVETRQRTLEDRFRELLDRA